jgi:hypothetical protein
VRHASPNYSSRLGARITLFVVHATAGHNRPGVVDLISLGNWFGNPASQVSSHSASDNEGHSARFVHNNEKAWHVAAFNRMAYGHEQVIPGNGTEITKALLHETSRWLAWVSLVEGVPLRKAKVDTRTGVVLRSGVIRHSELGLLGGGHADPGPGYNLGWVIRHARYHRYLMRRGRH